MSKSESKQTSATRRRPRRATNVNERTGVLALLCSPTNLSRTFTRTETPGELESNVDLELNALGLSDEGRAEAMILMKKMFLHRAFFEGIADLMKAGIYVGEEPHPERDEAAKIIAALRGISRR